MFKLEHHIQFPGILAGVLLRQFRGNARRLSHGHDIIFGQHLPVHLLQISVDIGPVYAVWIKAPIETVYLTVRHFFRLGDHADDVHAEPVDPFLTPPGHHIENFPAHLLVIPV